MSTLSILSAMRQEVASILQEKVAKSSDDEQRHAKLTGLAGVAGGIGAVAGQRKAVSNLQESISKYVPTPESAAVAEKLTAEAPTGVRVEVLPHASSLSSSFNPRIKTVSVAKDAAPEFLAHELGHAKINDSRFGRAVQSPATMLAGATSPLVGSLSGGLTATSDNKWVRRAGVAAPLLTSLPQLGYEGAASVIALRDMKRHGASPAMMSAAKRSLGNAFGTYAAQAGLGVGTAAATQGIRRSMHLTDRDKWRDEGRGKVANVVGDVVHVAESSAGRGAAGRLGNVLRNSKSKAVAAIGEHFQKHDHKYDLGGLGLMGAVTGNELRHSAHNGDRTGMVHAGGELAGLAALAAPVAAKMMHH